MARPSRTRLKRPIFWQKCFLKIHHFLSLINHSPLRHGPHALCLKSIFEQGKLKECLKISISKRVLDQMVFPGGVQMSAISQATLQSWPKHLYKWYGNCKIGDSWCSEHIDTIWPSLGWSCFQCVEWSSQVFRLLEAVLEIVHSFRSPHYLCYLY